MGLRPYQLEAVEAVEREWSGGNRRTLLVLPTGTGKTICFSETARRTVEDDGRVLILAHREELLSQAADKLKKTTGLNSALEKADSHAKSSFFPVVVGSVQTMMRAQRLAEWDNDDFRTVIVDEAHHALSESYQRVLNHFDRANVLGVTATPDRGDMRNLGSFFDSLAYEYPLTKAIKEGYLCKIQAQTIPLDIDITGVKTQNGDYAAGDLGSALEPYLEQIADIIADKYSDRKTVIFLPLVDTSKKFSAMLSGRGVRSWEVDGLSKDRTEVLEEFDNAENGALCNSMLLTEGWDCPSVDCIVVLRPTKIRSLYCQMVGRGTRLYPGKDHLLILDFLWHTSRHELCRPTCLICKSEEAAKEIERRLDESGDPMEISEDLEREVSEDMREARERALAEMLKEQRRKKAKLIDPLQFQMSILDEDLQEYEPTFNWELEAATAKQLKAIENFGISPDSVRNKGYASMLLDRLCRRADEGLSSAKQIRCLERYGFVNVGQWSFKDANSAIRLLSANRWILPYYVDPETYSRAVLAGAGL